MPGLLTTMLIISERLTTSSRSPWICSVLGCFDTCVMSFRLFFTTFSLLKEHSRMPLLDDWSLEQGCVPVYLPLGTYPWICSKPWTGQPASIFLSSWEDCTLCAWRSPRCGEESVADLVAACAGRWQRHGRSCATSLPAPRGKMPREGCSCWWWHGTFVRNRDWRGLEECRLGSTTRPVWLGQVEFWVLMLVGAVRSLKQATDGVEISTKEAAKAVHRPRIRATAGSGCMSPG